MMRGHRIKGAMPVVKPRHTRATKHRQARGLLYRTEQQYLQGAHGKQLFC
jgi:hypothetical protein